MLSPHREIKAFTLIELLVVIGLLVFATTLLTGLARVTPATRTTHCQNNLRQLSRGTFMYIQDNNDCFPGAGSRNTYGFHVEDWIYWRTNLPSYPPAKSPILAGFSKSGTNLFRCPADRDDSARLQINDGQGPNFSSYSMTSFGIYGQRNLGMTSIFGYGQAYLFKLSMIQRPFGKIMLAEEQSSYQPYEASNPFGEIINDGRFMPPSCTLTIRHNNRGNVSFADGHVSVVAPKFAHDLTNSRPDL